MQTLYEVYIEEQKTKNFDVRATGPSIHCSGACVAQSAPKHFPFHGNDAAVRVLAYAKTPRSFVAGAHSLSASEKRLFLTHCERFDGYFGACRGYARYLLDRPVLVKAQSFDSTLSEAIKCFDQDAQDILGFLAFGYMFYDGVCQKMSYVSLMTMLGFYLTSASCERMFGVSIAKDVLIDKLRELFESALGLVFPWAVDVVVPAQVGRSYGPQAASALSDSLRESLTSAIVRGSIDVLCSSWMTNFLGVATTVAATGLTAVLLNGSYWDRLTGLFRAFKMAWDMGNPLLLFTTTSPELWVAKTALVLADSQNVTEFGKLAFVKDGKKSAPADDWLETLVGLRAEATIIQSGATSFTNMLRSLTVRIMELEAIVHANDKKPQPSVVVFAGPPGTGKSTALRNCVTIAMGVQNPLIRREDLVSLSEMNTYYRSSDPEQKFWQGLSGQTNIVLEDIHAVKEKNRFPMVITELCNVYKARLTSASLEEKAKCVSNAQAVFATTNRENLFVSEYDMVQVARRISMTVDTAASQRAVEFAQANNLDLSKGILMSPWVVKNPDGTYTDYKTSWKLSMSEWIEKGYDPDLHYDRLVTFSIYGEATCEGNQLRFISGSPSRVFSSRAAFLAWFRSWYVDFRSNAVASLAMSEEAVCEYGMPESSHKCELVAHEGACCFTPVIAAQSKYTLPCLAVTVGVGVTIALTVRQLKQLSDMISARVQRVRDSVDSIGAWAAKARKLVEYVGALLVKAMGAYFVYRGVASTWEAFRREDDVPAQAMIKDEVLQKLREPAMQELEFQRRKPFVAGRVDNPWAATFDTLDVSSVPRTQELHILDRVATSTQPVTIYHATGFSKCWAFKVTAITWALPYHSCMEKGVVPGVLEMDLGREDAEVAFRVKLTLERGVSFVEAPHLDLIFIDVYGTPGKGLLDFFPPDVGGRSAAYFDGAPCGFIDYTERTKAKVTHEGYAVQGAHYGASGRVGVDGDCGRVFIARVRDRFVIGGVHVGTVGSSSIVSTALRKDLEPFIKVAAEVAVSPTCSAFLSSIEFEDLKSNSGMLAVPGLPAFVLGSLGPYGRTSYSKVKKTMLHDSLAQYLTKPYGPPYLGFGKMVDGEWVSPFTRKYDTIVNRPTGPIGVLKVAGAMYMARLKASQTRPLSDGEMFAGTGQLYAGPLPLKTSAGLPWRPLGLSPKTEIVDRTYLGVEPVYELNAEFAKSIVDLENALRKGPVYHLTENQMKDEPVSVQKAEKANTRLFSLCGADMNCVGRKYLLPLIVLFYQQREASGMMPGVNPFSESYSDIIAKFLTHDGWWACDQEKFDIKHFAGLFHLASELLCSFALECGYTSEEATIVKNFVYSCVHQVVVHQGDVFVIHEGLSSGLLVTTFLNCFFHCVLLVACFLIKLGRMPAEVIFGTYGDDLIVNLPRGLGMTMHDLRDGMALFGYKITSSQKGTELKEYDDFDDVTFLKRFMRWHAPLDRWVAPVEKDSIYRMLCWRMDKTIPDAERCAIVCRTALLEATLHGKSFFDELTSQIEGAVAACDYPYTCPTWEDCLAHFRESDPVVPYAE